MKKYQLEERFILNEAMSGTDWAAKYEACETEEEKKIFWYGGTLESTPTETDPRDSDDAATTDTEPSKELGYYNTVFGDKANKVIKLGRPFQRTLIEDGFDEDSNVWLKFVNTLLEKPVNKCGVNTLTELDLKMLIDALNSNIIAEEDLFEKTSSFGKYSLIFNPYFYLDIATPSDQKAYLQYQSKFKAKNPRLRNKREILGQCWAHIYQIDGSGIVSADDLAKKPIKAGSKLKALTAIEKLLKKAKNKNDADEDVEITDSAVSSVLEEIANGNEATACFVAAYSNFIMSNASAIQALNSKYGGIPEQTRVRFAADLSDKELADAGSILSLGKARYKNDQIEALMVGLMKKMGVKLPEDKE